MLSQLLHLLDIKLAQRLNLPQKSVILPPSPAAIMILLAACPSMQSHFLQSLSMPLRSQISPLTPASFLHRHPATVSMTAPHTGCSSMATALPRYMPMDQDQSVLSMQNPSLVILYNRNTHTKILCEHSKLRLRKRLFAVEMCVGTRATLGVV